MKGKLIVIEGSDASGKRTQSELLVKRLKKNKYKTALIAFPNHSSKTGKKISAYLKGEYGNINNTSPYFAAMLYADDRLAERNQIKKWLKEGKIVVVDRYVLSNKAHQSVKIEDKKEREDFIKWVDEIEYKRNALPKEDILIYLYVPINISLELLKKRGKRDYLKGKQDIHESNTNYLEKVGKQYLELVQKNENYIKIDCVEKGKIESIEDIHKKVWDIVIKRL